MMILDPEKYDYSLALLTQESFDESYYLEKNPDVVNSDITPFEHFLNYGWKEGRDPSADFSTEKYLSGYPDVLTADMNPLYHYIVWGKAEGRDFSIQPDNEEFNNECYQEMQRSHINGNKSSNYSPRIESPVLTSEDAPKVIAFYLPQFHPFKENDAWWGKGFTEWSNVAKAIPQFKEHYQPRLPSDLGYYDLRLTDVVAEQIDMAKLYGIEAFCFHYYWFAGHRLMEKPIEAYLENAEKLNFPFCLCWANENWSRRWDGSENDILIAQDHSEDDNENVFYDLLRYFKDKRYLTVNGKPLIVIYRPDLIPDLKTLTKQWRNLAVKEGLPGLHLVSTNAFGFKDYQNIGFDAIVEFPPHGIEAGNINSKIKLLNEDFVGNVYEYDNVIDYSLKRLDSQSESEYAKGYYPTVMTAWDNSARKPGKGNVFHAATPAKFQRWLDGCYRWSNNEHCNGSKFVFVNAWNEWAEGTYLEPDKKYGYSYLNAVRSTINENAKKESALLNLTQKVMRLKSSDTLAIIHIFYEDLIDEIAECITIANKFKKMDVAVSIPESFSIEATKKIIKKLKPVRIILVENRGRDIWPFIQVLDVVKSLN
jgi:lipopolysaccharide biosynthesis protein